MNTGLMVDSMRPIDDPGADGSLLRQVVARFGQVDAWGRYLQSGHQAGPGLSAGEVAYAAAQRMPVAPIYVPPITYGASRGATSAAYAVRAARELLCPAGVVIWADVEASSVLDAAWAGAWAEGVRSGGYVPGIYCSLANVHVDAAVTGAHIPCLWDADWVARPVGLPRVWPHFAVRPAAWQYAGNAMGGLVDLSAIRLPLPEGELWRPWLPSPAAPAAVPPPLGAEEALREIAALAERALP